MEDIVFIVNFDISISFVLFYVFSFAGFRQRMRPFVIFIGDLFLLYIQQLINVTILLQFH